MQVDVIYKPQRTYVGLVENTVFDFDKQNTGVLYATDLENENRDLMMDPEDELLLQRVKQWKHDTLVAAKAKMTYDQSREAYAASKRAQNEPRLQKIRDEKWQLIGQLRALKAGDTSYPLDYSEAMHAIGAFSISQRQSAREDQDDYYYETDRLSARIAELEAEELRILDEINT